MLQLLTQVEPRVAGGNVELEGELAHSLAPFREACGSPFLVAGGHSRGSAIAAVSSGQAGAQGSAKQPGGCSWCFSVFVLCGAGWCSEGLLAA